MDDKEFTEWALAMFKRIEVEVSMLDADPTHIEASIIIMRNLSEYCIAISEARKDEFE